MKTTILILSIILLFFSNSVLAKTINGKPRIVDGDTMHIKSNKIRLHGIDAPEKKQTCKINNEDWYCGKQSTKELKNLINKIIIVIPFIIKDLIELKFINFKVKKYITKKLSQKF